MLEYCPITTSRTKCNKTSKVIGTSKKFSLRTWSWWQKQMTALQDLSLCGVDLLHF